MLEWKEVTIKQFSLLEYKQESLSMMNENRYGESNVIISSYHRNIISSILREYRENTKGRRKINVSIKKEQFFY